MSHETPTAPACIVGVPGRSLFPGLHQVDGIIRGLEGAIYSLSIRASSHRRALTSSVE